MRYLHFIKGNAYVNTPLPATSHAGQCQLEMETSTRLQGDSGKDVVDAGLKEERMQLLLKGKMSMKMKKVKESRLMHVEIKYAFFC